ncbi:hypothetical protein [Baileyella intestinalis]|uniref:hypothetical protein n=1 Tax=Baileyella intestinalis TaxID=2606709 RepID=UPI003A8BF66E
MITVEEILEYLNSDRVEDMTEEMHERSIRILEETFTSEKMYSSIQDAASRIRAAYTLVITP